MSHHVGSGDIVRTPYGECIVDSVREGGSISETSILCHPTAWQLAEYSSSQPRFYLNPKDVQRKLLKPGDLVQCAYGGAGKIVEVRPLHYVVTLKNWQLADGKSPVLYLMHSAVSIDTAAQEERKALIKRQAGWNDLIEKAISAKNVASTFFKEKKFEDAKRAYLGALAALNNMGTDLTDAYRAEVLEHTIPCHNNIALCSMKDKSYEDAIAYANNGVMLIDALDGQIAKGAGAPHGGTGERKLSMVWLAFKARGMSYEKLIRDWKKKSLFYKGKAAYLAKKYDEAIENLAMAIAVLQTPLEGSLTWALATCDGNSAAVETMIDHDLYLNTTGSDEKRQAASLKLSQKDPLHEKQVKELIDLLTHAKADKKKEAKAQKARWSKAFAKNADSPMEGDEVGRTAPAETTVPPAPIAPATGPASVPIANVPLTKSDSKSKFDVSQYLAAGTASSSPRSVANSVSPTASVNTGSVNKAVTDAASDDEDEEEEEDDEKGYLGMGKTVDYLGLGVAAVAGLGLILSRVGGSSRK